MKNQFKVLLLNSFLMTLAHQDAIAAEIDYIGLQGLFGEPVTQIAIGKPQRVSETPVTVEIITADEIHRSGALDIPQLLRRKAGVEVSRNFKGHADVNLRGLNKGLSNRTLVLVNGRQVYLDNFGSTLWNALPVKLEDVKQIEILKGPNSSLLGFNAASGVINIITYSPSDERNIMKVRTGSQTHREVDLILSKQLSEAFSIKLSTGLYQTDGYSRASFGPGVEKNDALDAKNIDFSGSYTLSDNQFLQFQIGHVDQVADSMFDPTSGVLDLAIDRLGVTFGSDSERFGSTNVELFCQNSTGDVNTQKFSLGEDQQDLEFGNKLTLVKLSQLLAPAPNHTVRVGLEARRSESDGTVYGLPGSAFKMDVRSANIMWDWVLSDQFNMVNALRYDVWDTRREGAHILQEPIIPITAQSYQQSDTEATYNSSLVWTLSQNNRVRFSVGKGLHIPTSDEYGRALAYPGIIDAYGNPLLNPEEHEKLEVSYTRKLEGALSSLAINYFKNTVKDYIGVTAYFPSETNSISDLTFENIGTVDMDGVEISLSGRQSDRGGWSANYTYMDVSDSVYREGVGAIYAESNQPKHKINLDAFYKKGKWTFDSSLHYVNQESFSTALFDLRYPSYTTEMPDYFILNLSLSHQFRKDVQIALNGYNLIQEKNQRPSFSIGPQGFAGANRMGRTVLISLKIQM